MAAKDPLDPIDMLEPFSVPVTAPVEYESPADVAAVVAERRQALAAHHAIGVIPGSLHARYPYDPSEDEPVAVIADLALAGRFAAVIGDPLPGTAPRGDPPSDLYIQFPVLGDDDQWWPTLRVAGNRVQDAGTGAAWLVDGVKLTEVLVEAGVPERYLPSVHPTFGDDWPPRKPRDGDALTDLWMEQLSGSRPVTYEVREALPDRWIRFHSLPESRRHAEGESDYLEIIRRHRSVLSVLPGPEQVLLITCSWGRGAAVDRRPAYLEAITPDSWLWGTVIVEQKDARLNCVDLWVEDIDRSDPRLDQLFRMDADDRTGGTMLVDPDLRWIYAPYDGGADVIATDEHHREQLKNQFRSWLPFNGGLY